MRVIGHRGARYEAPENTLPGFRYAIGLGVDALEFDVRLTRDHQLAIIHDATVDRTTNGSGEVSGFDLVDLQALDAYGTFPEWPEPCRVPSLGEVLDATMDAGELFIEIKHDDPDRLAILIPLMVAEITRRDIASRVTITSFDPHALELARAAAPEIRRGFIGAWDAQMFLDTAFRLECAQIDANHTTARAEFVAAAKRSGLRVVGWPTNSASDLAAVRCLGSDLFCTDAPSLLIPLNTQAIAQ